MMLSGNGHRKYCVEIMDTTLRDGEQTPAVAFTPAEKLGIARLLINQLHVDRMEIGSARSSEGEKEAVTGILAWAKRRSCCDRMEILGFVDQGRSVEWIRSAGGQVINLLAKGSPHHCRVQLGKDPAEHRREVRQEVIRALEQDLAVNVYLEDWTGGMAADFGYVYELIHALEDLDVKRFMLADTLGCATPERIALYMDWMNSAFPGKHFDFHGHNDYGLVTANSIAAVNHGAMGIHTAINGLGERAGNQPLASLVVAVHDQTSFRTRIAEKAIQHASDVVQALSGKRFSWNMPVVGSDVFTQTCGVHADGDRKGDLYVNKLLPERFGRNRNYALGKLSGKASVEQNLEMLGLEDLGEEQRKKVLQEIVRLGDRKKQVTPADLPYIISNILRTPTSGRIQVVDYHIE
ncbi:MAG: 2-isopropylmalate synthase, partial [Lentisphaeria bacterium]|nr:2-isopropylmalate synthase [Lentisphaeria bacterium]